MFFDLNALFSLSVGAGAIAGWIRYKKTDPAYRPFILLLWAGLANELLSIVLIFRGYSNAFNYNLFVLVEAVLITRQFASWGLFGQRTTIPLLLQTCFIVLWIGDYLLRGEMNVYLSYYIIGYSAVIVLLSIHMLNHVLFKEPGMLLKHPVFLICMAFIIYFTYTIITETFWVYGLNKTTSFRIHISELFSYVNLITNLIYAFSILWIPMKRQYILRS